MAVMMQGCKLVQKVNEFPKIHFAWRAREVSRLGPASEVSLTEETGNAGDKMEGNGKHELASPINKKSSIIFIPLCGLLRTVHCIFGLKILL